MKKRKDQVIAKIRIGLEGLIRSNQIVVYRGTAQFESPPRVLKVLGPDSSYIEGEKIIIATGSVPAEVKAFPWRSQADFEFDVDFRAD